MRRLAKQAVLRRDAREDQFPRKRRVRVIALPVMTRDVWRDGGRCARDCGERAHVARHDRCLDAARGEHHMDKALVIIVPNEDAAYDVVRTLKTLDDNGSIELYSSVVITKTREGTVHVKDTHNVREPWGTLLGLSTGALIGLLAGPVGAAAGAAMGGAAGMTGDLAYSGFAGDFVHDVATKLKPGSFAVCASVWEDWTIPVDLETKPYGAIVYRQATEDVVVAQLRADWQDLKDQQAHLESEIARATGDMKSKLEARRAEIKAQQAERRQRVQQRARSLEESWKAKIASIKAKAQAAKTEAKARHEQHADKLQRFMTAEKTAFQDLFA
jgi:uncharacterized membrane protein